MTYAERNNLYATDEQRATVEGMSKGYIIYPSLFIAAGLAGLQLRGIVDAVMTLIK